MTSSSSPSSSSSLLPIKSYTLVSKLPSLFLLPLYLHFHPQGTFVRSKPTQLHNCAPSPTSPWKSRLRYGVFFFSFSFLLSLFSFLLSPCSFLLSLFFLSFHILTPRFCSRPHLWLWLFWVFEFSFSAFQLFSFSVLSLSFGFRVRVWWSRGAER